MPNHTPHSSGFTFIEVMVAMLIFVLAVLAAINIVSGSVRATKETRDITMATWLLQNVMAELEIKLETEGIDAACEKKKEGKFQAPHEKYRWISSCYEIDYKLSETAAQSAAPENEDTKEFEKQDAIMKLVLNTASDYLAKSIREIHAEVRWMQGKTERTIDVTTFFARYDQPVALPGLPGGGGGSSGTPTTTGGSR